MALGVSQVVIYAGKETKRKTRPAIAGLKTFCPIPPKVIFATAIANKAPISTTHQGVEEGRFSASSKPVTIADKSPIEDFFLSRYFDIMYSAKTQEIILTPCTIISFHP